MHGMKTEKPSSSAVCAQGVAAFYSGANYQKENSVGFLMKRGLSVLVRNLEHRMQGLDLTGTQWNPLLHVANGCDTVAACAREGQIDAGAMTRMLDRLESKGLIQRERSTEDRRVVRLALTPQGEEVAKQIPYVLADVINRQLLGFSTEEVQTMVSLLRRFVENGEALAEAANAAPGPSIALKDPNDIPDDDQA